MGGFFEDEASCLRGELLGGEARDLLNEAVALSS